MGYSDLLAVIGVGIAIWALLPEERKLLWGSFISKGQWYGLLGLLLLIHIVVAADWLHQSWSWFDFFYLEAGGIPSSALAYLLLLILLFSFVYLLFFTYPSKGSLDRLTSGYGRLLETGKIEVLNDYLTEHHYDHVSCKIVERKERGILRFINEVTKGPSYRNSDFKVELSTEVFLRLLQHRNFVESQSISQPEKFAKAFEKLYTPQCLRKPIVEEYCRVIISQLDPIAPQLLKELIEGSYDEWMESVVNGTSYMLLPLLKNGENAYHYGLWQPFAKAALRDLRRSEELTLLLESEYYDDDARLLDFNKLTVAIRFIASLYSLKLRSKSRGHMWIYYYKQFLKNLIDTCKLSAFSDGYDTYAVHLIEEIKGILISFLREAAENDEIGATSDIVGVYCKCLAVLAEKAIGRPKIEDALKGWFDRLFKTWFEFYDKVEGDGYSREGAFGNSLRKKWSNELSREIQFLEPSALKVFQYNAEQAWLKYDLIGDDLTIESDEVKEMMDEIGGSLQLSHRKY